MKTALLVDDDRIFNFLSSKTLERSGLGYQIHTALNGKQALDFFSRHEQGLNPLPNLILLDLDMPIMDGFSFLEAYNKLKLASKEHIMIIVVSSSQNQRDIDRTRELGVEHYMSKPLQEENLKNVILGISK